MFFKALNQRKIWHSAYESINVVHFKNNPNAYLKDNYMALGCISVLTNNGSLGTVTHLGTDSDLDEFISCL